jgi:Serine carboxypeptidase
VSPSFPATVFNFNLIDKELYDNFTSSDCYFSFKGVVPYPNSRHCYATWGKI